MTGKEVVRYINNWIIERDNYLLILSAKLKEEKMAYEKASYAYSKAMYRDEPKECLEKFEKEHEALFHKFKDTEDEIIDKKLHPKFIEILHINTNYNEEFAKALMNNESQGLEILLDQLNHFIGIYQKNKTIRGKKTFNSRKPAKYERHIKNIDLYLETLRTFNLAKEVSAEFSYWTEQALFAWELRDRLDAEIKKINTGEESKRIFLHTKNFSIENIEIPAPTDTIREALNTIFEKLKENGIEVHDKKLEMAIRRFFELF